MLKTIVHVAGVSRPGQPFSTLVVCEPARTFYVAGLLARDESGAIVAIGDAAGQTRQILRNLERAAVAAGGDLRSIVRVDVYVTDIALRAAVNEVRRAVFGDAAPVSTLVEVSALAEPEALVEITAIGVAPLAAPARPEPS